MQAATSGPRAQRGTGQSRHPGPSRCSRWVSRGTSPRGSIQCRPQVPAPNAPQPTMQREWSGFRRACANTSCPSYIHLTSLHCTVLHCIALQSSSPSPSSTTPPPRGPAAPTTREPTKAGSAPTTLEPPEAGNAEGEESVRARFRDLSRPTSCTPPCAGGGGEVVLFPWLARWLEALLGRKAVWLPPGADTLEHSGFESESESETESDPEPAAATVPAAEPPVLLGPDLLRAMRRSGVCELERLRFREGMLVADAPPPPSLRERGPASPPDRLPDRLARPAEGGHGCKATRCWPRPRPRPRALLGVAASNAVPPLARPKPLPLVDENIASACQRLVCCSPLLLPFGRLIARRIGLSPSLCALCCRSLFVRMVWPAKGAASGCSSDASGCSMADLQALGATFGCWLARGCRRSATVFVASLD